MSDAGRMFCSICHAPNTGPTCEHGVAAYISAGEVAERRLRADPTHSNSKIATEVGIDPATVLAKRSELETTCEIPQVEKVLGLDGRWTKAKRDRKPKSKHRPNEQLSKDVEIGIAQASLDEGHTQEAIAEAFGLDSVQPVKIAVAKEEGRREERAKFLTDPPIDPSTLSKTAQEKLEAAIRQHKKKLDAEFDERVRTQVQARVKCVLEDMAYPRLEEREKDAARIIKFHKGRFTILEYNAILRCLHPDMMPDNQQKAEAFQLWHENKIVLVSQKEDPKQYPSLPSLDEILMRAGKVN